MFNTSFWGTLSAASATPTPSGCLAIFNQCEKEENEKKILSMVESVVGFTWAMDNNWSPRRLGRRANEANISAARMA